MTTTKEQLNALTDRVEKLMGPDREVDAEIAVTTGWCLHPSERQRNDSAQSDSGYTCLDCGADSWGNTGPTGQKRSARIPAYTASLDAAATLVLEGCGWIAGYGQVSPNEPMGGARISRNARFAGYDANYDVFAEAEAATPALALTAAALRARAEVLP